MKERELELFLSPTSNKFKKFQAYRKVDKSYDEQPYVLLVDLFSLYA